jgi:uncharacterized repeat protein (TIGR03803 family)
MNQLIRSSGGRAAFVFLAVVLALPAQTLITVANFNGANGTGPAHMSLVQGVDGNFYGTTNSGGAGENGGTIFEITPTGTLTTLYNFCTQTGCPDGANPSGLVQATDGTFYGATAQASAGQNGTIFKITPGGALTTLYSFCSQPGCTDGGQPGAALVQATNGELYGTTCCGGAFVRGGTAFKITLAGALTTLYTFGQGGDGAGSYYAALVQGTDGDLYGTTGYGDGAGTVFKLTPNGAHTKLHSFCPNGFPCADGAVPLAGLVQATDGDFYGTTAEGGPGGPSHSYVGSGTVFKMTPGGALTTLYIFCSQRACTDGAGPTAGLVQATDGNFYGATSAGGAGIGNCGIYGCGTLFRITPGGTLTTLHSFQSSDGWQPTGGLLQGTDGNFYGTTGAGGADGEGTVFKLDVGLGPFVKTFPTSGKVGAAITILGTNLTGATSVTFDGAAAVFTVNHAGSAISTTVPAGATTGKVEVTTPSGTLVSNAGFRVAP